MHKRKLGELEMSAIGERYAPALMRTQDRD